MQIITSIVTSPDFGGLYHPQRATFKFPKPFGKPPQMMIALSGIECAKDSNPSVSVHVEGNPTKEEFTAVFQVKDLGYKFLTAQYIAFGE